MFIFMLLAAQIGTILTLLFKSTIGITHKVVFVVVVVYGWQRQLPREDQCNYHIVTKDG